LLNKRNQVAAGISQAIPIYPPTPARARACTRGGMWASAHSAAGKAILDGLFIGLLEGFFFMFSGSDFFSNLNNFYN
jgi:hypothetical protein